MIPPGRYRWAWSDYWREQRRLIETALRCRRMGWREESHKWARSAGELRKERVACHGR